MSPFFHATELSPHQLHFCLQWVKCNEILSTHYRDGQGPKMLYTPRETSPLLLFRLSAGKTVHSCRQ